MTDYALGDASVTFPDWNGTAQLDHRRTAPYLSEVIGLDPDEWMIVSFDLGGGEKEHGRHRLNVYAVHRDLVPEGSDVFPRIAAAHDGEIPVTQFLVHDVDPYEVLRAIAHQFELRMRTRGSGDYPIRVVSLGDVPEQES